MAAMTTFMRRMGITPELAEIIERNARGATENALGEPRTPNEIAEFTRLLANNLNSETAEIVQRAIANPVFFEQDFGYVVPPDVALTDLQDVTSDFTQDQRVTIGEQRGQQEQQETTPEEDEFANIAGDVTSRAARGESPERKRRLSNLTPGQKPVAFSVKGEEATQKFRELGPELVDEGKLNFRDRAILAQGGRILGAPIGGNLPSSVDDQVEFPDQSGARRDLVNQAILRSGDERAESPPRQSPELTDGVVAETEKEKERRTADRDTVRKEPETSVTIGPSEIISEEDIFPIMGGDVQDVTDVDSSDVAAIADKLQRLGPEQIKALAGFLGAVSNTR